MSQDHINMVVAAKNKKSDLNTEDGEEEQKFKKFNKAELVEMIGRMELERKGMVKVLENKKHGNKPDRGSIKKGSLEAGFYRIEKYFERNGTDETEKITEAEECLSEDILEWCLLNKLMSLDWKSFKSKIRKEFDEKISMQEFRTRKQKHNETTDEYLAEMFRMGRKLKESEENIIITIKENISNEFKHENCLITIKEEETLRVTLKELEKRAQNKKISFIRRNQATNYQFNYHRCGKPGHIRRDCKENQFDQRNNFSRQGDTKYLMNNLEKDKPIGDLRVNGIKLSCLFDTGADINLINAIHVVNLKLKENKQDKYVGNMMNGTELRLESSVNVEFEFDGKIFMENFYVLNLKEGEKLDVVFGYEFLRKNEINLYSYLDKHLIIKKFTNLFSDDNILGYQDFEAPIETINDDIIHSAPRRIAYHIKEDVDNEIKRLLDIGYIVESRSNWSNPINPVRKPDGSIRLTIDFRMLNKIVKDDNYSIPRITDIIDGLRGKLYFSVMDLKEGYMQIKIKEEDPEKTAFRINHKTYHFKRLAMGFKNAPAIFQRIIDRVLKNEVGKSCYVYLDDIIVFGLNKEEHDKNFIRICELLLGSNLLVNKRKLVFRQKKINFLGFTIQQNEYKVMDKQIKKVEFLKAAKTRKELQRVIGFINYFRRFIKNCSMIMEPMTRLLRKDVKYVWGEEQESALKKLKDELNKNVVLAMPNYDKDFIIYTDASKDGIGGILMQETDNNLEKVVEFASRGLSKQEIGYGISEREALAIKWAINKFQYYLRGRRFIIRTDHKALVYMDKERFQNARIQRWVNELCEYNFNVEYVKGEDIPHVDFLSRQKEHEEEDKLRSINKLEKYHRNEEIYKEYAIGKYRKDNTNEFLGRKVVFYDGKYYLIRELKLLEIPRISDRKGILEKTHADTGHSSSKIMEERLKKQYYWNGMLEGIKNQCKKCDVCREYNTKVNKTYSYVHTTKTLEKVGIDLVGPFHKKYIVTWIDYFTRLGRGQVIDNKNGDTVSQVIESWIEELGAPKMIISDNGKEFANIQVKNLMNKHSIDHHFATPYRHESNGRVERFHRTLMSMVKKKKGDIKDRLKDSIAEYNENFHRGIMCSPNEVYHNTDIQEKVRKRMADKNNNYFKSYNVGKREKFQPGNNVWFKNENKKTNTIKNLKAQQQ